jgi:hypothetical protein
MSAATDTCRRPLFPSLPPDSRTATSIHPMKPNYQSSTITAARYFPPVYTSHDRSTSGMLVHDATDTVDLTRSNSSSLGDGETVDRVIQFSGSISSTPPCPLPPTYDRRSAKKPSQPVSASIPIMIRRRSSLYRKQHSSSTAGTERSSGSGSTFWSNDEDNDEEESRINERLSRLYDQRTWDMFTLITTARQHNRMRRLPPATCISLHQQQPQPQQSLTTTAYERTSVNPQYSMRYSHHHVIDDDDDEISCFSTDSSEHDMVFDLDD